MAKAKTIADAQWEITVQLTVGPDNTPIGPPHTLRYADSVVADGWEKTAYLIAGRLNQIRALVAPKTRNKK